LRSNACDQTSAAGFGFDANAELITADKAASCMKQWQFTAAIGTLFCSHQLEGSGTAALVDADASLLAELQIAAAVPGIA
jgi:hypothetical protein